MEGGGDKAHFAFEVCVFRAEGLEFALVGVRELKEGVSVKLMFGFGTKRKFKC